MRLAQPYLQAICGAAWVNSRKKRPSAKLGQVQQGGMKMARERIVFMMMN